MFGGPDSVAFFSENSSSRVGAVRGLPEESVSNGVSGRRQTKLP